MHNRKKFHSATNRRPLTRGEAARVLCAPMPKLASEQMRGNAGHATRDNSFRNAIALCLTTWLVIIALTWLAWVINFGWSN